MVVDPADELLAAVEEQLSECEEVSSVTTQDVELVSDPLHSSSFFEEPPLHTSSFVEESPSQSLSVTDELSVSIGPTADSLAQPDPSTEQPSTFTCGCSRILKGKPCSTLFSPQYYQSMRDSCAELLKNDLDNIIKGQIMAFTSVDDMTRCRSRHSSKEREKVRGKYYHQGHKICWRTFAYLHGIGKTRNQLNTASSLLITYVHRQREVSQHPSTLL